MKNLLDVTKVIASVVFFCVCSTVQGQSMLGYETTPARPLVIPKSSQRQTSQESTPKKQVQKQEQIVRLTGYYYKQNAPVWGSPTSYSICNVSLKVKIINSYSGETYQVTEYKTPEAYSWQTCYGSNVSYDKNEEAYSANLGSYKVYFNL